MSSNMFIKDTAWMSELIKKYNSGIANAFVVTGNIGDYANDQIKIEDYIAYYLKDIRKMDEVAYFDIINGTKYLVKNNDSSDNEPLATLCEKLQRNDFKRAYIISYPAILMPSDNRYLQDSDKRNIINLHKALSSVEFMTSNNMVIFLCESIKDLNPMFISSNTRTSIINITLPSDIERHKFIKNLLTQANNDGNDIETTLTEQDITKLTAGLSLVNIEDIILQAIDEGKLNRKSILNRKKELIQKEYSEIIELYDTEGFGLSSFAGQEDIKSYFKDVIIDAIKNNTTSIVPKGVLLMGPPGTGKTYFSRCLAGDAGINFVEFKMSKILDKWVGEAEKNLERAFSVFRALAPVGVFIDEMDQALSRGDNDSNSVNKNLFGMFLSELSKPENRGKIVWLGATNYPNKIDEALKRSGRFDKKIPFFAPSDVEREAVFKIHLKKTKMHISSDVDITKLSEKTEGYTQAEIENIVVKTLELALRRKERSISMKTLEDALDYMLPAQNSRIKEMEDIALLECNDLEFLPQKYRERQNELFKNKKD